MIRAFIDASVLFAAAYSGTGAAREIIRLAAQGEVRLVISQLAFQEARRNLQQKASEVVTELDDIWDTVDFEIVRPTKREVQGAMKYTAAKDAPIIAAAKSALRSSPLQNRLR